MCIRDRDVCDHVGMLNKGKIMIERSLTELQGNISKIQIACPYGMPKIPQDFKVLHMSNIGRVYTVIGLSLIHILENILKSQAVFRQHVHGTHLLTLAHLSIKMPKNAQHLWSHFYSDIIL